MINQPLRMRLTMRVLRIGGAPRRGALADGHADEGYRVMGQQQEDLTRTLASALWRSAFTPYHRALDAWLAAEEMVAEALRAVRDVPEPEVDAAPPALSLPSSAFPVAYVHELAQCFWEHSARSSALSLDIWLAAERHVRAVCQAALAGHGVAQPFSAEAHWERIRDHAEWLWHVEGRPGDRDLDTWLRAEAEVLAQADGPAGASTPPAAVDADAGDLPRAAPRPPLALAILAGQGDDDKGAPVAPWYAPSGPEHREAHPSL